ncbi:unnamed protein product [Effrenium voratum]|nr:unnamed protein product [Effrenium voratum]
MARTERLLRFWQSRKYKPSVLLLMICYGVASAVEYVLDNDYREATKLSMGQVPRANYSSVLFMAYLLSLVTALVLSAMMENGRMTFLRRALTFKRILHFGLIGTIFLVANGFIVAAKQSEGPKVWCMVAQYFSIPVSAFISQLYFKRRYSPMMWICFLMMTFSLCTFIALRERYKECPLFSDIQCGSKQAVLWIQQNVNTTGTIYAFVGMVLNVVGSILAERLFHAWKDNFAVLKINMDFAAMIAAGIGWAVVYNGDDVTKKEFNAFELWGSWKWMDYAHVVIIVVDSWMGGLVVMKLSTTVKTMIRNSALLSVLLLLDSLSQETYNFGVRMGPSLMLAMIVYMSFMLFRTAEVYEDERKLRVIDVSELPRMKSKVFSDFEAEDEEDDSPWWQCNSPWLGCYDRKWKGEPDAPEEQPPEKAGSGMDSQMMIISLVYAATDTTRTLLNSYALSSSQINPNSMSFLTFLVGLVFASLMTWRAHGLGCAKADEELGESESGKGLKQAWSIRKIIEYGNSSMLQAVTMCLGNMAYAFGLSPSMAAVLGKVYTPVLAVGERLILKKRRQPVEWFAVIILTLGTFAFLWLQIYDFEEGLGKAMSNMLPLILCILGAVTAAIQALVSQGIYEANRDVDFYMNKVRFDAGSAIFTLLVVPLLSLTASRGKDLVWLPRAVEADCDVNACWPKVTSFSNGGSIHWPWSMEDSMMTCTAPECTGVCACQTGLFAGWGLQPALYAFLAISVLYGILVGIIYDRYGSLHRAKCDSFGLLLTYWIGNPILNYFTKGESFTSSLKDECLDIVSFIVPLAALATDFGKIMTSEMLQKTCSFRLGLVAGLISRLRGKEVALMISDPAGIEKDQNEEMIELIDQRATDVRKKGAQVRHLAAGTCRGEDGQG